MSILTPDEKIPLASPQSQLSLHWLHYRCAVGTDTYGIHLWHKSADHAKVDVHTDNILEIQFLHSPTRISEVVILPLSLAQCETFSAHFKDTEVLAR